VWAREQEAQALVQVKALTGIEIAVGDSMKPELVAKALREIGVNPSFNAKGTPSVTAPFLDAISHPVGAQIRRARQMDKLRNTYVNGIKHHLTNGRIHCTFNQLMREGDDDRGIDGTIGGRVSAVNPNLQNQPIRHEEIGVRWRSIYIPEEGKQWAVNDFSQQEPRLLVHWSVLAGPRRIGPVAHSAALEAARRYTDDPSTDFHEMMAEMSGLAAKYGPKKGRKYAKSLGLGKIYGMGGVKLCRSLDLPTQFKSVKRSGRFVEAEVAGDEGQAIMDRFDAKVPFASAMLRADSNQAEKVGFIRTLSKRRCRCRKNDDGSYDWLYKMLNRRIQGSAADQTKEAVCALDAAGYYIQIQVHDEIDGSVADAAEARRMAEIMEQCMPLMVPSKVDVEIGPNWGEVKGV
jgi:DNA polymerase I-like protein with 3'-5' exonuclease and polymerase domains